MWASPSRLYHLRYLTVNFTVVLFLSVPETPVNVTMYVPALVFLGNRTPPEMANAVPLTRTVCGRPTHFVPAGPPVQLSVTFPMKPCTDFSCRMTPPLSS